MSSEVKFHAQLTGHETFPLRQLWLSKLVRYINQAQESGEVPTLSANKAIVELGVGKNMVSAMRFWADAAGIVNSSSLSVTDLGQTIFGGEKGHGLDECCSNITTQWLVHWQLASTPSKFTAMWYLFNKVTAPTLDRETFFQGLCDFCKSMNVRASNPTVKRSVDVTLRSYIPRLSGKGYAEDLIEPLLSELDLLEPRSRDVFAFRRGAHPTLPDALFAYALFEYWERQSISTSSLDFNRIAHDIGSPGKVYKLDPESINDRLYRLSDLTDECLIWTEQAGLRQVIKRGLANSNPAEFKLNLLRKAYL